MSVYKALAAAVTPRGEVEMPDGQVYRIAALSLGDVLSMEALQASQATDAESLPVLAGIVARCTGAPMTVVEQMLPESLGPVLAMARHGVDAVVQALGAEASASGNGAVGARSPSRSTSRKKR